MTTILIVDDNKDITFILSEVLKDAGYEIFTANNIEQAKLILSTKPIDLLISDIIMPGGSGLLLISEIRAQIPDLKVIAISGGGRNTPTDQLESAKSHGADAILAKPFSHEDFLDTVSKLCG